MSASDRIDSTESNRGRGLRELLREAFERAGVVALTDDVHARLRYRRAADVRRRNEIFAADGAPDGLPLPPPDLVYLVGGHFDLREYYETGEFHSSLIRRVLHEHGRNAAELQAVLDFGCGCGRVIRHWRDLEIPLLQGSDYNTRLVDWCRRSLPFARFSRNDIAPPLPLADETFDLVYAISVFTHLTAPLQHAWAGELTRILRPGGILLITTKGISRVDALDAAERQRFEQGELVVKYERYVGRNLCAAFHPERYLRESFAPGLRMLGVHASDVGGEQSQDVSVFERVTPR